MRPVSVRFRCFGPYMAEQFIDFRELEKNGLFLICGETGAGKTTILDAICYALYGRSSGGLRGDLSVMRCKLADRNDETLTEFIFDVNGKRYKFIRTLKYARKNMNDFHNCLEIKNGEEIPVFENPKATVVNKKAEELIGLTYDQFRQVIILPQGQFEKLLVSNSEEKEKILVSLFHADRWQRIAEEFYRRIAQQDAALKQEKLQIAAKLKEYGCDGPDVLAEKIARQRETVETASARAAAAEETLRVCRQTHDGALVRAQAFLELSRRERLAAQLAGRTGEFEQEQILLAGAERADRILPQYTAWQQEHSRKLRAEGILAQKQRLLKDARENLSAAKAALERHEQQTPRQEERKRLLTILEEARELYRSLEEKRQAADRARKILRETEAAKVQTEQELARLDRAWQAAMDRQNRAYEDYQQAQRVYLHGIGSTLAEKLETGEPCPVCGSRDHPAPARATGGHVTEAQLDGKNRAVQTAGEEVSAALQRRNRVQQVHQQTSEQWNLAAQAEAVACRDYENAMARKIPGIDTYAQLDSRIQTLRIQIRDHQQAGQTLADTMQKAVSGEQVARAEQATAGEEWTAAAGAFAAKAAQWAAALTESGLISEERFLQSLLEPEEKQRRAEALIRFRTELAGAEEALRQQREELSGQTAPDMAALQKRLAEAGMAARAAAEQKALACSRLQIMVSDGEKLEKRSADHDAARITVDGDLEFANRLRGRSGVSLQRYVLGVMLTSVAAEANRLLQNVYSGRYRLYRTDEISGTGRKGGLELEVYDSHTNARRSVTTLSGGEKFLVALSLAIGLSTVVQAQGSGIRLEAMFIDEGFGSLDREAVGDALEVLQGVRRSTGVVGIISHVEQLAETIPTRLEITKGKQGSNCRIVS